MLLIPFIVIAFNRYILIMNFQSLTKGFPKRSLQLRKQILVIPTSCDSNEQSRSYTLACNGQTL